MGSSSRYDRSGRFMYSPIADFVDSQFWMLENQLIAMEAQPMLFIDPISMSAYQAHLHQLRDRQRDILGRLLELKFTALDLVNVSRENSFTAHRACGDNRMKLTQMIYDWQEEASFFQSHHGMMIGYPQNNEFNASPNQPATRDNRGPCPGGPGFHCV